MLSLEELVQELINDGKGDVGRLEHILSTLKKGQSLYSSDQDYLEKLLAETRKSNDSIQSNEPKIVEFNSESTLNEHEPKDATMQPTEIELLRKEIHKLQDRNHIIEEHLRNKGSLKSGSWLRAFGRGIAGIAIFLFGLGMIFALYYFLSNLDDSMRGMYYGDPWATIITAFVIAPAILLSIGGSSIYYGIRIISKT